MKNILFFLFISGSVFAQTYRNDQLDSIIAGTKEVFIPTSRNSNGDKAIKEINAGQLMNKTIAPPPNVQYLDGNGTYTPSAGIKYVIVELVGGGGAGGGASGGSAGISVGDGGGGGGHLRCLFYPLSLDPAGILCFVGVGGVPSIGGNGGAGGNTAFGSLAVAYGGSGGSITNIDSDFTVSGVGNVTSGGSTTTPINFLGSNGANKSKPSFFSVEINNEKVYILPGQGGDSPFGNGGSNNRVFQDLDEGTGATGVNGAGYGSGGSGAYRNGSNTAKSGGVGGPGYILITEYF